MKFKVKKNPEEEIYTKSDAYEIAEEILEDFAKLCKKIVNKYKKYEKKRSMSPSAPDTSKFMAIHEGDIKYVSNDIIRGGRYGLDKFISAGIRVGFNVDGDIRKKIRNELSLAFSEWRDMFQGDSESHIRLPFSETKYGPHYSIIYLEIVGSAYSVYGIEVREGEKYYAVE